MVYVQKGQKSIMDSIVTIFSDNVGALIIIAYLEIRFLKHCLHCANYKPKKEV